MYPELPQDMGEIWPHWVRFVWPQKMGSARLAVLWPRLAKVTIDKVKNVFWLKVIFFKTSIQINFIFVVSNGQSDIAAFCRIFRAFWQINSTASWPTVPPPLWTMLKKLHYGEWRHPLVAPGGLSSSLSSSQLPFLPALPMTILIGCLCSLLKRAAGWDGLRKNIKYFYFN